jgi:hypothetical protein
MIRLECEQWRHGVDPKIFQGRIHLKDDQESASGALECRVDAENLSTPERLTVPVRITFVVRSSFELAAKAVDDLISRSGVPSE